MLQTQSYSSKTIQQQNMQPLSTCNRKQTPNQRQMAMHQGFVDYNNEDLATILGETFPDTWPTAAGHGYSSSFTTTFPTELPFLSHVPPPKQRRLENSGNFSTMSNLDRASSSFVVNFGNVPGYTQYQGNWNATEVGTGQKPGRVRAMPQAYDHISAERKRREQLSQLFITLSSIVPGLKKLDKTSVLGDAINYMKELKEKVKMLEDRTTKQTIESVVHINKKETMSTMENNEEQPLPEIEAKVSENSILLNILCEKRKGLLVKILAEVEKLNLVVVNTSAACIGAQAFHITILAEMEKDFSLTLTDVVSAMRCALLDRA